ncbi:MAG: hypothetical protein HFP77_10180 [Methylococcales symbiont of Iophon sp. n. MRB-2018]|nr:MAG: hypothetical protein HFP77_10180 [Methylococcales symbiont of Iophon sp. n. MRB-2018]KAF3979913.1 MAG: hypothetical protein HFP76_04930 [Methylococcales symbiont of Iophon sp. n. MRB-2018]
MPQCAFCGKKEEKDTPLCHSCGAMRYPVEKKYSTEISPQDKLKLSAAVVAAIVTPGSLVFLALAGANHFNKKNKK